MLPQSDTERILEERLESLGVKVQRQAEVVGLSLRDDGGDAVIRTSDGREEKSLKRIGWSAATAPTVWCATPSARPSRARRWTATLCSPMCTCAATRSRTRKPRCTGIRTAPSSSFPISPGRYRLLGDMPPSGEEHPPTPTLEQIQALADRRGPPGMTVFDPIWLAGFRINGRKVTSYRWGRAFLCGDAAHVHSPGGRPGHEHRHAGRLQPGMEAGVGRKGPWDGKPPRQLTAPSAATSATRF